MNSTAERDRGETMDRVGIRLRRDLHCQLQEIGGACFYLVEDPIAGKFFRVGPREWTFASACDGGMTIAQAVSHARYPKPLEPLTREEALAFGQWLVQSGLGHVVNPHVEQYGPKVQSTLPCPGLVRRSVGWRLLNPFFIRVPLLHPDPLLSSIADWTRWLITPWFFAAWLALCALGVHQIMVNWPEFADSTQRVLARDNWLCLAAVWLTLKAVHELAHGIVCKAYGGHVPRAGLVFILCSPMAFVDVTSSWRFRRAGQRIFTAAAGMYVEFLAAAVAAIVWSNAETGLLRSICHNVIISATVTTLIFNANPLMRFDGYYILSDLVGMHNLYARGQQYTRYLFRRYFMALPSAPLGLGTKELFIRVYGIAAMLWRIIVMVSLTVIAATLFHGAGIVLSCLAIIGWIGLPTVRFGKYLRNGDASGKPRRLRMAVLATIMGGTMVLGMMLPWPVGHTAPAAVEFAPLTHVRAESSGFVDRVLVNAGERVREGAVLAILKNPETELRLEQVRIEIKQSAIKSRIYHRQHDLAQYQAEEDKRVSLEKQRVELSEMKRQLVVRAPVGGRVIGRDLDTWTGRYVRTGATLFAIGSPEKKELRLTVAQEDVEQFHGQVGQLTRARVQSRWRPIDGAVLSSIEPKASVSLPHPALASLTGGPLTVRLKQDETSDEVTSPESEYELVSPRFNAVVSLPDKESLALGAGQLANVRLAVSSETIGQRLLQIVTKWYRGKVPAAN